MTQEFTPHDAAVQLSQAEALEVEERKQKWLRYQKYIRMDAERRARAELIARKVAAINRRAGIHQ